MSLRSISGITALFDQADAALRQDRMDIATKHSAASRNPNLRVAGFALQQQNHPPQQDPFMGADAFGSAAMEPHQHLVQPEATTSSNSNTAKQQHHVDEQQLPQPQEEGMRLPRLPAPTIKAIIQEGQLYAQVMSKVVEELEKHSAARDSHVHVLDIINQNNHNKTNASNDDDADANANTAVASSSDNSKSNVQNKNENNKFLRSFAKKIALPGPNLFPSLFEHFLSLVSRSQQAVCALAVFADCSGPAVLIDQSTSISATSSNPLVLPETNALVVKAIPEPIRRAAELAIFQAAIDCGKVADICPGTLVALIRSREWNTRLGECVTREMERLYREMIQLERQHFQQQQQQQQPQQQSSSLQDKQNELIRKRSDALLAVFLAQQREQALLTERGFPNDAAQLGGTWLLFVRTQIAPRVLKWVQLLVDPVGDSGQYVGAANDIRNQPILPTPSGNGSTTMSFDAATEDIWLAFARVHQKVLIPCLGRCDCDSVRTVLYRCLLIFESRMRRQHHAALSQRQCQLQSDGAASFISVGPSNETSSHGGTGAGNKTMADLAEDALCRNLGAAVYAATFTTNNSGGQTVFIAEGEGLTKGPIQFYVAEKVNVFAKRGKLRSGAAFQKMASIDELVKFARG